MKTVTSRTISDKELHGELELSEIVEIAKSEILRLKTVNSFDKLLLEVEEIPVTNGSSSFDDGYYRMVLKICSKEKAIGFLVGQTMKAMKGKADPGMINKMLKELL